jgi:hypothetical protein
VEQSPKENEEYKQINKGKKGKAWLHEFWKLVSKCKVVPVLN